MQYMVSSVKLTRMARPWRSRLPTTIKSDAFLLRHSQNLRFDIPRLDAKIGRTGQTKPVRQGDSILSRERNHQILFDLQSRHQRLSHGLYRHEFHDVQAQ